MGKLASVSTREEVSALIATRPPVLIEVRFPKMATSSDWHLVDDLKAFDALWSHVAAGVELHVTSVWDLPEAPATLALVR
jgi:hypothetical protein